MFASHDQTQEEAKILASRMRRISAFTQTEQEQLLCWLPRMLLLTRWMVLLFKLSFVTFSEGFRIIREDEKRGVEGPKTI